MDIFISFILKNACSEDDVNEESIIFEDKVKEVLGEKLIKNISELRIEKVKKYITKFNEFNKNE